MAYSPRTRDPAHRVCKLKLAVAKHVAGDKITVWALAPTSGVFALVTGDAFWCEPHHGDFKCLRDPMPDSRLAYAAIASPRRAVAWRRRLRGPRLPRVGLSAQQTLEVGVTGFAAKRRRRLPSDDAACRREPNQ